MKSQTLPVASAMTPPFKFSETEIEQLCSLTVPVPEDEEKRVSEVRKAIEAHDRLKDENHSLEEIAMAAKEKFGVPIIMINFVDVSRQFHMVILGEWTDPPTYLPRDDAICPFSILPTSPEVYIVKDIGRHHRFQHLAINKPNIIFYAGAVLENNGQRIGALCMIDRVKRPDLCSKERKQEMREMAETLMKVLYKRDILAPENQHGYMHKSVIMRPLSAMAFQWSQWIGRFRRKARRDSIRRTRSNPQIHVENVEIDESVAIDKADDVHIATNSSPNGGDIEGKALVTSFQGSMSEFDENNVAWLLKRTVPAYKRGRSEGNLCRQEELSIIEEVSRESSSKEKSGAEQGVPGSDRSTTSARMVPSPGTVTEALMRSLTE